VGAGTGSNQYKPSVGHKDPKVPRPYNRVPPVAKAYNQSLQVPPLHFLTTLIFNFQPLLQGIPKYSVPP